MCVCVWVGGGVGGRCTPFVLTIFTAIQSVRIVVTE